MKTIFDKQIAFTLAEVLITLGVIGVVAAITIPTLIKHYQQHVVVTRLQKFYTNMNQAIKLSQIDNDECTNWNTSDSVKTFYDKYLNKYLKTVKVEEDESIQIRVYFSDGSLMKIVYRGGGYDINFYPKASSYENIKHNSREVFTFNFMKSSATYTGYCQFEPYTHNWDGTRDNLVHHERYGCNKDNIPRGAYCTKLIQYDGWKISNEYPW